MVVGQTRSEGQERLRASGIDFAFECGAYIAKRQQILIGEKREDGVDQRLAAPLFRRLHRRTFLLMRRRPQLAASPR